MLALTTRTLLCREKRNHKGRHSCGVTVCHVKQGWVQGRHVPVHTQTIAMIGWMGGGLLEGYSLLHEVLGVCSQRGVTRQLGVLLALC